MSYDIYLADKDKNILDLKLTHSLIGGTYVMGGTKKAWLNVTYNYGKFYYEVLGEDGIRTIYDKPVLEGMRLLTDGLRKMVEIYGAEAAEISDNYWEPTPGNATKALTDLIYLGTIAYAEHPDSMWYGD